MLATVVDSGAKDPEEQCRTTVHTHNLTKFGQRVTGKSGHCDSGDVTKLEIPRHTQSTQGEEASDSENSSSVGSDTTQGRKNEKKCLWCTEICKKVKRCRECKSGCYCSRKCRESDGHFGGHGKLCGFIQELEKIEQNKRVFTVREVNQVQAKLKNQLVKLVGEKPFLDCSVGAEECKALWDTGAMVSLVSTS